MNGNPQAAVHDLSIPAILIPLHTKTHPQHLAFLWQVQQYDEPYVVRAIDDGALRARQHERTSRLPAYALSSLK